MNDMSFQELRDELSYRKLTNQLFLCEGKIDLKGKLVETTMPFKDNGAFEIQLESIVKQYDEGSTINRVANNFAETV